jgi:hypothetical protein
MPTALKFGLCILGVGLFFVAIFYSAYGGGIGPCALPGELSTMLLAAGCTAIGALVCLITLPVFLVKRFHARRDHLSLTLFGGTSNRS